MRIYSESTEENLRARKFLKQWTGDGLLSKEQYQRLEPDTVSDLRTTNIFLRLVLFFFTIIAVAAAVALFFTLFLSRPSEQTTGIFLLIFAAVSYAAAEFAVVKAHMYRYGVEEALAVCSVALLCAGVVSFFFSGSPNSMRELLLVVPTVGTIASLWIWYRFNLWYAFPAAMIFAIFLPGYWTQSHAAQHIFIAVLYAAGLICIATIRSRHRFDYLRDSYSLAEAFLWLGMYLIFNLKLSAFSLPSQLWSQRAGTSEFAVPVLLDDVGAHMVPAAPHTRTRHSPERSPHHRGRHDYCHPHLCHQQTVPRLAAAHLGPDASRHRTDWRCSVPSTLAR